MKCPFCGEAFAAPVPRCPSCKLHLQKLDLRFGLVPAHSRFITDRGGAVSKAATNEIRQLLRQFHKRFPQSILTIFITELTRGASVTEFAFWLANRGRFTATDKLEGENYHLLFVLDRTAQAAALTSGYGLEKYVPQDCLQRALDDFAAAVRTEDLAAGLRAAIATLTEELRQCSLNAPALEEVAVPTGAETW